MSASHLLSINMLLISFMIEFKIENILFHD